MSRMRARKHVARETLDDLPVPENESEIIVRVLGAVLGR
jgi:hypothetical protein